MADKFLNTVSGAIPEFKPSFYSGVIEGLIPNAPTKLTISAPADKRVMLTCLVPASGTIIDFNIEADGVPVVTNLDLIVQPDSDGEFCVRPGAGGLGSVGVLPFVMSEKDGSIDLYISTGGATAIKYAYAYGD